MEDRELAEMPRWKIELEFLTTMQESTAGMSPAERMEAEERNRRRLKLKTLILRGETELSERETVRLKGLLRQQMANNLEGKHD